MLLSLISIYPIDCKAFNPTEDCYETFNVFYYKQLGANNKDEFYVTWHEPTEEEK